MGRADTMASWDFTPTQPSTPISARHFHCHPLDPFASFSTTNSPYNTLPSRTFSSSSSLKPASPSDSSSSSSRAMASTVFSDPAPLNQALHHHHRRRDPSRASQSSLLGPTASTSNHRRNISFDFGEPPAAVPVSSPVIPPADESGGGAGAAKEDSSGRVRDVSVASTGSGSVHFAPARPGDDATPSTNGPKEPGEQVGGHEEGESRT